MSFSVAVPTVPVIDRSALAKHDRDESALDTEDLPPLPPLAVHHPVERVTATGSRRLHASEVSTDSKYELQARPQTVRVDSKADTIIESISTSKDLPEPDASENIHSYPPLDFSARSEIISAEQKKVYKRREWIYFSALAYSFFVEGWNDGTVGPLLPVIRRDYGLPFEIAALLFVFNCFGFVLGALSNVWLNHKIGFGKVVFFGSIFQLVSYCLQAPHPPFPVMVLGFAFAGYGMSLQNAQGNGFVSSLQEHRALKLNLLHAFYGLGAFASPLVATYFSGIRNWSFHYIISAGLAVVNTIALGIVFRGRTQNDLLATIRQAPPASQDSSDHEKKLYREIMAMKAVHFMALFALLYVGIEVTLGGWIVTFIIRERDGGQSAGYISSGFFAGLTLGRILLIWISQKIGERRAIFVYTILSIALEITIWLVPSIYENAVAVSFIGLLLGPMFPILVGHTTRIMPHRILTGTIGWVSGIGMAGSAILPFITGLLAGKYGIGSLQPFLIAMMCTMIGMWALVPAGPRRVM